MWRYFCALVGAAWNGNNNGFYRPFFNLIAVLYQWVSGAPSVIYVNALKDANLAANYANGTLGAGRTLTKASAGAFPTVDGVVAAQGNVYFLTGQSAPEQNGPYTLSTDGSSTVAWVLTGLAVPSWTVAANMIPGSAFYVTAGTTYGGQVWAYTGAASPTVGTTALTFARDGLLRTAVAATVTAAQSFAAGTLRILNGAGTFYTTLASNATANRTLTAPDVTGFATTQIIVTVPCILAAHSTGSIAARFTPGVAGVIQSITSSVVNPVTTGAKLGTFAPAIAGTPTTGGAVALTSANCTPVGAKVNGSAITALNAFTAAQEITIVSSAVTAFIEGEVVFYVTLTQT